MLEKICVSYITEILRVIDFYCIIDILIFEAVKYNSAQKLRLTRCVRAELGCYAFRDP